MKVASWLASAAQAVCPSVRPGDGADSSGYTNTFPPLLILTLAESLWLYCHRRFSPLSVAELRWRCWRCLHLVCCLAWFAAEALWPPCLPTLLRVRFRSFSALFGYWQLSPIDCIYKLSPQTTVKNILPNKKWHVDTSFQLTLVFIISTYCSNFPLCCSFYETYRHSAVK